jgi:outer membrane protein
MKKYLLLITLLVPLYKAGAQDKPPVPQGGQQMTLEECVSYALENNFTLQNAIIDEEIAQDRVNETRGYGLPQVNASATVIHNEKLPRFFAMYGVAKGFNPSIDLPLEDTDVVASPNFFQLKNSGDASVSITQLLFNASYLVGLRAANAYKALSIKSTVITREEVVANVSSAYYACLINKDRITLFESNIARVDTLYRNTKAMQDNGLAEQIDVDRLKVSLNNLVVERNKFIKVQDIAMQLLKFQMNYPLDQPLIVTGDISQITVDPAILETYRTDWDYTQRSDYQLLMANRNLQALNLRNKYAEGMPSLNAFANLGYSTQSPTFNGVFKTTTPIVDDGLVGPDKWYNYSNFGLSLNVPIFSGLQRSSRVQQAKGEIAKIDNNVKLLKNNIDREINQTTNVFLNAIETAKSQQDNIGLAENVARVTRIKYEQGVGSNLEVVEAETALREAQINYYNALYDAILAKIELDRAYGKLVQQPAETK